MPAPTPTGTPITEASPSRISVPTIALPMPPPVSPTGLGRLVKNSGFSAEPPWINTYPKTLNKKPRATSVLSMASPSMTPLVSLRSRWLFFAISSPSCRAIGHTPHKQPRKGVEEQCHTKEHQTNLDESRQVELVGGLGKLVGYHAGHGVRRCEQGGRDLWPVADHHRDRHGLAQGAPQPENEGPENPGVGIGQHCQPNGLPSGCTQRQHRLPLGVGDGAHHVPRYGSDGWDDHYGQDQPACQQPDPVHGSLEEGQEAEGVSQHGLQRGPEPWSHHEDAPQPVYDTGYRREQFDHEGNRTAKPVGSELGQVDRRADADRASDRQREE